MTERTQSPAEARIAQYRIITAQLAERGSVLIGVLKRTQQAKTVLDLDTISRAFQCASSAVLDTIRLELDLDRLYNRGRKPNAARVAQIVDTICRNLDDAAALLPGVPSAPPHANTASLRDRALRLAMPPPKRTATILPFPAPQN